MKQQGPKHIVCFALPAWEADYLRSTVELMKGLAVNNLVLYIDYAYTISDCIKGIRGKKNFEWKRLLGINPRLRKISGNTTAGLYVLSLPPILPAFLINSYLFFRIANKFNALLTGIYINRAIKKLNMQDIVGFNSFQPFLGRFWKIKKLTFLIYYIYDDFTNVPWFKGYVKREEEKFLNKVDLIVVSSDELKRRKQNLHKPIEVVNNGVHFDAFYNYINQNTNDKQAKKTVGYTGTIDNRINIDLLEPVVSELPGVEFLFIGKVFEQNIYDRLNKYPNVKFIPPVPAERIPELLTGIAVGIIPYVCNELTAAIYPLKVNEYLAMGLPVIMTAFASIGEANDVVCFANDSLSFKKGIEQALAENQEVLKLNRLAVAKKADWNERSKQLFELIEKYGTQTATPEPDYQTAP